MLTVQEKIRLLKKLLDKSKTVTVEKSDDPNFKAWNNLVERTLIKVFGKESTEFEHFNSLNFFYFSYILDSRDDTHRHLKCFREDFKMLLTSIEQYIEELEELSPPASEQNNSLTSNKISKVFISHATADAEVVEEVIDILETIGLESNQIFCTSFEGYGIDLGENFLDAIKEELSSDCLVIFLLSKKFYESQVCLCEMGATWVLAKEHIPVLIPPLDFSDVKGVIPLTQGFKINEPLKLNIFKDKIEKAFSIQSSLTMSTWERKRDRILARIEKTIE